MEQPTVQINSSFTRANDRLSGLGHTVLIAPPINGDYWLFRVPLSEDQAIIAFPKFTTIGIGFQREKADWNTNLPFTCDAEEVYAHIAENKGDDAISKEACIAAIRAIQDVCSRA